MGDIHRVFPIFADTNLGTVYTTHLDLEEDVGGAAPSISFVGDAVKEWWDVGLNGAPAAKTFYKSTVELQLVRMRRIRPLEDVVQEYSTGLPIDGTSAGEQLAPQISVLASLRTAQIGRSRRGRMYLPAPTELFEESVGAMSEATAQDIGDGIRGLVLELDIPGQFSPVVYSETLNSTAIITRVLVDRRFRSQRKRAVESTLYVQAT